METQPDLEFRAHLAAGRFMLQYGVASGAAIFYPRTVEPGTGDALIWAEASGHGTVYATTVVRRKPPEPCYNVALIDLEEGPRMMSRVEGVDPTQVSIGMKVTARIIQEEAGPLIVFTPADRI